jgi:hypothetical protein
LGFLVFGGLAMLRSGVLARRRSIAPA